ncbi:hypothetical protein MAM1_0401c10335 [Mucor ambiguus]|uniref:Uncharacterized protein n=1 Tax=Mucor ambiguus TaxID=91626 RepID=A0A0C9N405_9FUNG|nr:hypothetical protein MAM1_0401c10335 [Mucor ambiguus]
MAITRSQQREIERRQREEYAAREQEEAEKRHALRMAVKASLDSMPESLRSLERNMSNLNTNDDISVATTTTTTMHGMYKLGRLAGREHTNPLDQPLNMDPVSKTDTQGLPKFSKAQIEAYNAQRQESMFAAISDTDISANSATYISNSSGGSGSAVTQVPRERLSSLSLESDLDSLEHRATNSPIAVRITEERRESVSTQEHTDSTATYEEFSINTEQHAASPPP